MSGITVVSCPACGAKTGLESGTSNTTCPFCGGELGAAAAAVVTGEAGSLRAQAQADIPKGLTVQRSASSLVIVRRWFGAQHVFLAIMAVLWLGFAVFFFASLMPFSGGVAGILPPLIMALMGIYLVYYTLAGILNTTTIQVTAAELVVKHGPVPWLGGGRYVCADLRQLFTREVVRHTKQGTRRTYTLSAMMQDGRRVDLLSGANKPDTWRFIEQEIETWLHIPDSAV